MSWRRIGRAIGRLFRAAVEAEPRPDVRPGCEFGLLVEERLADLQADLGDVKRLLRWLLLAVIGALVGLVADLLGAI